MNRSGRRLVLGGGIGLILGGAIAAQRQYPAEVEQPAMTPIRPQGANMRKRLSDPALRAELRAQTLEGVRSEHPEIAKVLGLDPELEARLFDVLTDHVMAQIERSNTESPRLRELASQGGGGPGEEPMWRYADEETRAKVQIHDVLGDERFDLYIGYMDAVMERRGVQYYEQHLERRDWLTADQRERLIALLRVERQKQATRDRDEERLKRRSMSTDRSEASRQKERLERNQDKYRHMLEDTRALLAQLPAILTPRQLDAYRQMEASELARKKAHVEQSRARVGLKPEFDETQLPLPAKRRLVAGKVRLELTVTVDPHLPVTMVVITENGSTSPAFEFPEGLWIEATPTLDEDGWVHVAYTYLEERGGKRFRLLDSGGSGYATRGPDGEPLLDAGNGPDVGTVRLGRQTLKLITRVKITPME